MSPLNLALRAGLEAAALAAYGAGGFALGGGAAGVLLGLLCAASVAAVWGTFNVPGDPSRSGRSPVAVPGVVRLMIELDVLAGAAVLLGFLWSPAAGIALGVATVVHYVAGRSRVAWLLSGR